MAGRLGSLVRNRLALGALAALVIAALAGGALLLPGGSGQVAAQAPAKPQQPATKPGGAAVPVQVAAAQPTTLQQKTTLTGEFQSQDKVSIVSRISSRVTKLPVEIGQTVAAGATLVELDRVQLDAALEQAKAQVASAEANYKKLEAGARPEDVAAAQAGARQAAERLASSQAQAAGVRAQDIANAQAAIAAAEARLRQVTQGATAADLANAEAALRGAQARLQTVQNGAKPQDIDIAVQALNQAREGRSRQESALSTAKEAARLALDQAASAVRSAQSQYGAAKLVFEEAQRTGKDPNVPTPCPPTNKKCNELTDIKLRSYKAAYESAEQSLKVAESAHQARQFAYEDSKKQEIVTLQQQDATIQSAQAQLDKLKAGATPEEIASSQAAVEQSQAALDKLNQPAREPDVAAAQAAVTQARAALARLQATPNEVATSQAAYEQQVALAAKAAAPYLPEDLAVSQAQVVVARAGVKTAEANLRDAAIVAPFAGLIATKNVSEGALASAGTVLLELVSVDVRGLFTIEEAQVGQVRLNQAATLTTTAFPNERFQGVVSIINPTANATTRSFGLKITPQDPQGRLKSGMFAQAEIVTAEKQNALAVAESAVLTREGKAIVFVIVDGKAQRREVQTGLRADGKIELTGGVQAGEQIVTVGQNLLNDGDTVAVR